MFSAAGWITPSWYHGLSFSEAAAWLEQVDADLFSLAVHYLTSKEHSARTA